MRKALFLTAALLGLVPAFAQAAESSGGFTPAQRTEIENIIKDYLTDKNPDVLREGLQNLEARERDKADAKTKAAVADAKDRIYNDAKTPVGGNPKGDVTIVEFYDYNCGYCKMSEEGIQKLLKEDKNIRFIYKDFPILGAPSGEAAKASLASIKQGKFQAFHDALMTKKDHLSSDGIMQTAKDVGLDVEKLKKDMADQAIVDQINVNLKLGQDIGVQGTPMFIIGDNIYPGVLQPEQLKKAVSDARSAGKK